MFLLSFSEWTPLNLLIRVLTALVLGFLIGLDRSFKRRVAGTKTNTIVCLGSALVMLTAQYMDVNFPGQADMSRMAAQVISGVGFLGVGTIIVSGQQVRGLTTAASLWTCACIGLAAGIGFIDGAIIICILMLVALHLLPKLEKAACRHTHYISLYIELESTRAVLPIIEYIKGQHIIIDSFDITKAKPKGSPISVLAILHIKDIKKTTYYISEIEKLEDVNTVETLE